MISTVFSNQAQSESPKGIQGCGKDMRQPDNESGINRVVKVVHGFLVANKMIITSGPSYGPSGPSHELGHSLWQPKKLLTLTWEFSGLSSRAGCTAQ